MISGKVIKPQRDSKQHWNKVYSKNEIDKLGWFEDSPMQSLQLIRKCNLAKDARLLNVGAGATTLVDELLEIGYTNLIANDISAVALEKLRERLGDSGNNVQWIVDDLTNSTELIKLDDVSIWHDRAVLHFFNKEHEQNAYFKLLKRIVAKNGFVILATFNLVGATKCSGLDVYRYDKNMLAKRLGNDFELVDWFNYVYTMPSGDTRDYIYTLFKRVN